jgi:hypothetical protein
VINEGIRLAKKYVTGEILWRVSQDHYEMGAAVIGYVQTIMKIRPTLRTDEQRAFIAYLDRAGLDDMWLDLLGAPRGNRFFVPLQKLRALNTAETFIPKAISD